MPCTPSWTSPRPTSSRRWPSRRGRGARPRAGRRSRPPRASSTTPASSARRLSGGQFVVATQNHDQVGNRAAGERSSVLMSDGRLRVAAALLLTSPFVPLLFQGEEWGATTPFQYFTGHNDPGLGRVVSEGRRHQFSASAWDPDSVPDPQDPATFRRSRLDWPEIESERHASLLAWYRRLIALRRQTVALTDPRLDRTEAECATGGGPLAIRPRPAGIPPNP